MILVILVYGVAEAIAKNYAEDSIEDAVSSQEPLAQGVEADVSLPLLLALATRSEIRRVQISVSHVSAGEFSIDRITAVMFGVKFDRPESLRTRKPVIESIDRLDIGLEISEAELSRVMPEGLTVELHPGSATLMGPGFEVDGKLELAGARSFRFMPSTPLPAGIEAPSWEIGNIPFGSCFRSVEMEEALLRVTCALEDPPARFPTSAS